MNEAERRTGAASWTAGDIFELVRTGAATSRAELVRLTGLANSTVLLRIEALLAAGYLVEEVEQSFGRGRRPRVLSVRSNGVVGMADLGSHHAVLGVMGMNGKLLIESTLPFRIEDGPSVALPWVVEEIRKLVSTLEVDHGQLLGIGLGLPGPVDSRRERVISPSRMPGWNKVNVKALLAELARVPTLVENDANLMAVGEHDLLAGGIRNLIFLKAGSGIGCGVVLSGSLYRGSHGVAGDVSHVRVNGAPDVTCSCGRRGCLEVVASGAAVVRRMRDEGIEISNSAEILDLLDRSDPIAARILREAGQATGEVLASLVSFVDPDVLSIGGVLSGAEPFVAALQATLYDRCLPLTIDGLTIMTSKAGPSAGILGAGRLLLDHILSRDEINAVIAAEAS